MEERRTLDIVGELRDDLYRGLIAAGVRRGLTALLVVRDHARLRPAGQDLLAALGPALVSKAVSSEWLGTQLLGDTATLYRFELTTESAGLLADVAESLYDWVQPALPEDLCMLRTDGTPWLVTIAHERDAYLELSVVERQELLNELPELAAHISSVVGAVKFDDDVGPVWLQVSTVPGAVRLVVSLLRPWDVDLMLGVEAARSLAEAICHPGKTSVQAHTVDGAVTTVGMSDGLLSVIVDADRWEPSVQLGAHRPSVATWLQSASTTVE